MHRLRSSHRLSIVTLGLLCASTACGGGSSVVDPTIPNRLPTVTVGTARGQNVLLNVRQSFSVSVTDPDLDPLDLKLVNPEPGMSVVRTASQPGSLSIAIDWVPRCGGFHRLYLRATDGHGETVDATWDVQVVGHTLSQWVAADVTGDGIPDAVAVATNAGLGVAAATGEIYVFAGQTMPTGGPTATLTVPGAVPGDGLGVTESGQAIQCVDVTGDGVLDVVAGAWKADVDGVVDAGAIYVWAGGPTLAGAATPLATLAVPGAKAGDGLGGTGAGQGIQCYDVTNDGLADVIAGARGADVGGVANAGAVYVWAGGATLTGNPAPTTTLVVPGAAAGSALGYAYYGQAILVDDVTGDGILDVVAGTFVAPGGAASNGGAVYLWKGGSTFTGAPAPTATLTVPGATTNDSLGYLESAQGLRCEDVTGDGIADVLAGASLANVGGVVDAGAIYLWKGGAALTGALAPTATLTVPGAGAGDQLAASEGLQCRDVTGDGIADVTAGASKADVSGVVDVGAIYVWSGGPAMSGGLAPTATLTVPGAVVGDALGFIGVFDVNGVAIQCQDVTGDGVNDVVAGAWVANVGGVVDAGAIFVWGGGAGLSGTPAPTATLSPGAGAVLPGYLYGGEGLRCCDVTGDGVLDVVLGCANARSGAVPYVGAIYVWTGGAALVGALSPAATLTVTGATAESFLGAYAGQGQGLECFDVTGDGVLDVVATSSQAGVAGVVHAGAAYVWKGGASLLGALAPTATLTVPGAVIDDQMTNVVAAAQGVRCIDLSGDGELDLVALAPLADVGGLVDAGAIYAWNGGAALTGDLGPTTRLTVPGAATNDRLGR